MAKQHLNITIDWDIYVAVKNQGLNISNLCNEFLRNVVMIDEITDEETKVQEEIMVIKEKQRSLNEVLASRSAILAAVRSRDDKAWKERVDRQSEIKKSGVLQSIAREI